MLSLFGCAAKQETVENTNAEIITILKPKGIRGFEDIINKYEKNHKDVHIKVVDITDDTNEIYKIYTATLGSKDSDINIYLIDEIWTDEFAQCGYLEPLDLEINKEEYVPHAIEFFSSDGVMYALPFSMDLGVLFYRKDRIADTPADWGDVINGKPQPIFEKKEDENILCESIELGEHLKNAYPFFADVEGDGGSGLKIRFKKGETDYYRGWSKEYVYLNDYAFEIGGNVGVMIPDVPVLGGYGLALSSFSGKKEAAKEFLTYISDIYNIREIMKTEGYIPVQKKLLADKMFADYNPCMGEIENILSRAATRKSDVQYRKNAWDLQKQLYTAVSENREPPELKSIYNN